MISSAKKLKDRLNSFLSINTSFAFDYWMAVNKNEIRNRERAEFAAGIWMQSQTEKYTYSEDDLVEFVIRLPESGTGPVHEKDSSINRGIHFNYSREIETNFQEKCGIGIHPIIKKKDTDIESEKFNYGIFLDKTKDKTKIGLTLLAGELEFEKYSNHKEGQVLKSIINRELVDDIIIELYYNKNRVKKEKITKNNYLSSFEAEWLYKNQKLKLKDDSISRPEIW